MVFSVRRVGGKKVKINAVTFDTIIINNTPVFVIRID